MKKIVYISCLLFLSSCSLFKGSVKKKSTLDSVTESSSAKTFTDIDTSNRAYTRKWKLTFQPVTGEHPLPSYQPPFIFSDLGTDDMKSAMQKLQKSYNMLAGKKPIDTNSVFSRGYQLATLEMEETMNEQIRKSREESQKDTTTNKVSSSHSSNEKQPVSTWLVLGCVLILAGLVFVIIKRW